MLSQMNLELNAINEFTKRINKFVGNLLKDAKPSKNREKIIHDSVWGTNVFFPWEVGLINSPLLQRLRRIHQTGLAFLVYPTANHKRFDHSLGVTILVDKVVKHLNTNVKGSGVISDHDHVQLRLAALLHDIGHSFFSHVSELVYERMDEFQSLKKDIELKYGVTPKGHEILSCLMLKTESFIGFWRKIENELSEVERASVRDINWERISNYIIGYSEQPAEKYLCDIINGPMDCDKLDYLSRDAKFAGPIIAYDIDRFLHTINIVKNGDYRRLTVTLAGVNVIEQLIISKMMMFSYVYHHHKLRAIESMIKRLCFDIIKDNKSSSYSLKIKHPVDFLNYTDDDILKDPDLLDNSEEVKNLVKKLRDRDLWVRAQQIACFNTEEAELPTELLQLERDLHIPDNIKRLMDVKEKIISIINEQSKESLTTRDIWIDVPFPPTSNEPKKVYVKKRPELEESIPLSEVIPLEQWVDAYKTSKLRIHVFCDKKNQTAVFDASKKVFHDEFGITLKGFTKEFCKIGSNQ